MAKKAAKMRWDAEAERILLVLALADAPSFKIDAARIMKAWPKVEGRGVPTVRGITDHFNALKKETSGVKPSGTRNDSEAKTTPKTNPKSLTDPFVTPTKSNGPAPATLTPATPDSSTGKFVVSSLKKSLNAIHAPTLQKSKLSHSAGRKRKRTLPSDDDEDEASMTDSTSGDEIPVKKARGLPPTARRSPSSLRSRSLSVAAPKYRFEDDGASGSGEDDAAKEIDSEDEFALSEDDRKLEEA